MIGALALLALAQAVPAAQASFALICKAEGTLGAADKVSFFPQARDFGILVRRNDSKTLAAIETYDPSSIFAGRQFTIFRQTSETPPRYGAATGVPGGDPGGFAMTILPSNSDRFNEWKIAFAPLSAGARPPSFTVGRCLLLDGVTQPMFQQLVATLGKPK
jgi:hypothetical protein